MKTLASELPSPVEVRCELARTRREANLLRRLLTVSELRTGDADCEASVLRLVVAVVDAVRHRDRERAERLLDALATDYGIRLMLGLDRESEVRHA